MAFGRSEGGGFGAGLMAAVAVAIGISAQAFGGQNLPMSLAPTGMAGCQLWHSADVLGLPAAPAAPATLTFSAAMPVQTAWLGTHVYLQAYAFAPGANPLSVVASNGLDWLVGDV